MGRLFYGAADISIRGNISSVIISPRVNFSWGRYFIVTPARRGARTQSGMAEGSLLELWLAIRVGSRLIKLDCQ